MYEENIIIVGNKKLPTRILLVDDHPLMRRGMRQLLSTDDELVVVGEVSSGLEALEFASRELPDLIMLDLNMKGLSGLDTLQALRKEGIDSRVAILTVSDAHNDIFSLIDAGADGYLLKDSDPELLLQQIKNIAKGKIELSDSVRQALETHRKGESPLNGITNRERDVLNLVAKGLSNKQVALELHISEETVKVHIRNLLRKLNVHSRLAATILYFQYFGKEMD